MLKPYTTMKIGGPAKYFLRATDDAEIMPALAWARQHDIPVTVLGAGSNVLVADHGVDGLVLVMANDRLAWQPPIVLADAGAKLGQLIGGAVQHGLGGLRWLIGVPGTVGGSIVGNAGSRDEWIGQYVNWVEIVDEHGQLTRLPRSDCGFSYRTSVFKSRPWVIIRAQLTLPVVDPVAEKNSLAATAKAKNAKQPTTAQSAGCMFKNPAVETERLPADLQAQVMSNGTLPAWRAIVAAGLQGQTLGRVRISERHANFMVAAPGATADEVVQLLSLVKQKVRDTLGIQLHEEVRYIGFDSSP